MQKSRN